MVSQVGASRKTCLGGARQVLDFQFMAFQDVKERVKEKGLRELNPGGLVPLSTKSF